MSRVLKIRSRLNYELYPEPKTFEYIITIEGMDSKSDFYFNHFKNRIIDELEFTESIYNQNVDVEIFEI